MLNIAPLSVHKVAAGLVSFRKGITIAMDKKKVKRVDVCCRVHVFFMPRSLRSFISICRKASGCFLTLSLTEYFLLWYQQVILIWKRQKKWEEKRPILGERF